MGRQHSTASKSGGSLKRSTGLMKLQHMKYVMSWKEDLKQKQEAEYQRRMEEKLGDLMWELRALDLAWEAWFDDDANVPNVSHAQIIPYIERRIAALKTPMELRRLETNFTGIPSGAQFPSLNGGSPSSAAPQRAEA